MASSCSRKQRVASPTVGLGYIWDVTLPVGTFCADGGSSTDQWVLAWGDPSSAQAGEPFKPVVADPAAVRADEMAADRV